MLILDNTTFLKDGSLHIPTYHRGHLSLKSGTAVTVCLLPGKTKSPMPVMSEVIVTPIMFDSWPFLSRISAVFHDRPGTVRKLARAIRELDIDILYEESASIETGKFHRAEFLVDLGKFYKDRVPDPKSDREILSTLERKIQALCLNELILDDAHRPRLKVRQMEGVRNAWKEYDDAKKSTLCARERTVIKNGEIEIPPPILDKIDQEDAQRALIVSDTKDRVLRVLFPNKNTDFTYIRVGHHDSVGALAQITDHLANGFNAVFTLNRLKTQRSRNDVELLLYSEEYPNPSDADTRKKIAENLLSTKDIKYLDIEVSYPKQAGVIGPEPQPPRKTKKLKHKQPTNLVDLEEKLMSQSTVAILRTRMTEYRKALEAETDFFETNKIRHKLEAANILFTQETDDRMPSPRIFMSYDFGHDSHSEILKAELQKGKSEVVDGKSPIESERYRDAIRQRILKSNGFVGIWRAKDDGTQSPWFLWELAIAQAMKLPYCLFVHEALKDSPNLKIIAEKHHVIFSDLNFENEVAQRIPSFVREVGEAAREQVKRRKMFALHDDDL